MTLFTLPGAERFAYYLEERVGLPLTTAGPTTSPTRKKWKIYIDELLLGEYILHLQKEGENDTIREFHGRVPGYVSPSTGDDHVVLCYSNVTVNDVLEGKDTGAWKRHDSHHTIPFP
ncbi:hypothetical protein HY639_02620 [Candidatus Woesearchaeota archaeon]|nr:hypothetical protein [Candidatus Woesearchaeota archaeon]